MFAVAFVLFLLGSGCVRDARGLANNLESRNNAEGYYACGGENRNEEETPLRKCNVTVTSDDKRSIKCSGGMDTEKRGSADLTGFAPAGDSIVLYTDCNGTVIVSPNHTLTGPFTIYSDCFSDANTHDANKCGSVDPGQPHNRPKNCTEVLSEYEKRKPAPTKNDNAPTTEDKKESPKQKQNDSPATRQQRSEVNATEQNRPTSVERNESKELTAPHTSTRSGTVLLTGLHARVFCVLQLPRLLK
ncbi:hypothetical protein ERJ75_001382700 [Trypanosoma vivax]|nr:hypothetical protein ERJ75_001382700 [Trypanosoma vivax]